MLSLWRWSRQITVLWWHPFHWRWASEPRSVRTRLTLVRLWTFLWRICGRDAQDFKRDACLIAGWYQSLREFNLLRWRVFELHSLNYVQPGHEYTKGNAEFALKVTQDDAVKSLMDFAKNNKETQGKFTIGDEKVFWRSEIWTFTDYVIET